LPHITELKLQSKASYLIAKQSLEIVVHKQSSKQIVKNNKSHSTQQKQQQRPIAMKALQLPVHEEEITTIHKKKTVEKLRICAQS
jgi:hypothetical protein